MAPAQPLSRVLPARSALAGLAALAALAQAGTAMACSPSLSVPSSKAVKGDDCAIWYQVDEINTVGLQAAQDLGGGFVAQRTYSGNACHGETSLIVHDCARGEVLVIGAEAFDLMAWTGEPTAMDRMETALADLAGQGGLTLGSAEALGRDLGLASVQRASTRDRLKIDGRRFALSCACREFHPGLRN